jgi:hypothetical protein
MLQRLYFLLPCLKYTQKVIASFCKLLDNAVTAVTAQQAYLQTPFLPLYLHHSFGTVYNWMVYRVTMTGHTASILQQTFIFH